MNDRPMSWENSVARRIAARNAPAAQNRRILGSQAPRSAAQITQMARLTMPAVHNDVILTRLKTSTVGRQKMIALNTRPDSRTARAYPCHFCRIQVLNWNSLRWGLSLRFDLRFDFHTKKQPSEEQCHHHEPTHEQVCGPPAGIDNDHAEPSARCGGEVDQAYRSLRGDSDSHQPVRRVVLPGMDGRQTALDARDRDHEGVEDRDRHDGDRHEETHPVGQGVEPQLQPEGSEQEAEEQAAGVPHEDAGGGTVPPEE